MGRTLYHTPLSGSENIDTTTLNAVFSELDSALVTESFTGTAGENLNQRDFVYLDTAAGTWKQIGNSATGPVRASGLIGIVTQSGGITSASTGTILLRGLVSGFSSLIAGNPMWSVTSQGSYSLIRPAVTDGGGQRAIIRYGVCLTTTTIYFSPSIVSYAKRATTANNGTLTIEHHSDPQTRRRSVRAYVGATYDEPLLCGSYAGSEEIGVAYGDGSGSDQDTQTTFKNLTGSSADITCIVEIM